MKNRIKKIGLVWIAVMLFAVTAGASENIYFEAANLLPDPSGMGVGICSVTFNNNENIYLEDVNVREESKHASNGCKVAVEENDSVWFKG